MAELARRGRLHLLDPPRGESLEHGEETGRAAPAWEGADPAEEAERDRLRHCWRRLAPVQRYVLEAMLIEQREANEVLDSLRDLGLKLSDRPGAGEPDRQQLYYFRRKALAELARLMAGGT